MTGYIFIITIKIIFQQMIIFIEKTCVYLEI